MGCAHPLTSMFKTSSLTDSSTSATQSTVNYDEVDGGGKSVKNSSKSRKIVKKPKKPQRSEKIAKAIGSEKRLPRHRFSVKKLGLLIELWQFFELFLLGSRALLIPRSEQLSSWQG